MMTDEDLRDTLRELAAAARLRQGPHPEPQALLAYKQGALQPAEEERMQDHLVACPQCPELLIGLDRLANPAAGAPASAVEQAAAWRLVWTRLRAAGAARERTWTYALAACLAAVLVGSGLWVGSLRRTLDEVSRPQLNAPVLDLRPMARGEEAGAVAEVPAGARLFTLVLNPAAPPGAGVYRAEIFDAAGRRVWSGAGLRPNSFDSFSLTLSRQTMGPGVYRLRLERTSGPRPEAIGDYALRVRAP